MSQQHFSAPPSELVREAHKSGCEQDSNIPRKQTREEYRKLKELEELRKAGSAPAAVDEQGHDINPHIPQYMVDVPWYVDYDHSRPTLRHQRIHPEKKKIVDGLDKWYLRGQQLTEAQQKFKHGACENCGATTHSRKDCLERPRKIGAKYGGGPILPDEFIQPELNLSWDGKRDRWNGVDITWHQEKVLSEFNKLEEVKKTIKHRIGDTKAENDPISNDRCSDDDEDDEDKYVEEMDMPGQKVDSKQRISVRNLRIREDTAKYLLNLDPDSAYYDPKSRSMRENPFPQNGSDNILFTGDNFVRASGDAQKFSQSQLFAWESYEKGIPVHLQADPTKLQLLHREFREKKNEYISDMKKKIVETYGGEEHLQKPPRELLSGNENYVEYNRKGQVIVGNKPPVVYSRYEEDVFVNGHTTIWGSFYEDGKWGYACCKSIVRNSYCTGNPCAEDSITPAYDDERGKSLLELHKEKRRQMKRENQSNESKNGLDQQKLKEALKRLESEEKEVNVSIDERKRSYNSLSAETALCNAPSAEEIEAYRLKRIRAEDPMRDYISKHN